MESFIFLFALLRTVGHFFALAGEFKLSDVIAPLAFLFILGLQEPTLGFVSHLHQEEISFLHL
jgi:hypothetical protein